MEKFLEELLSALTELSKGIHKEIDTVFGSIFKPVLGVNNKMQNTKSFSRQYQKKREKVLSDNAKKFIEENVKTQKDWEKFIKGLCKNNHQAALNALMVVYDNQTSGEKQLAKTVESNGIGFNAIDARILTRIAKKYKNDRYSLNVKEIDIVKSRILKYWRQIMNEAKENIEPNETQPLLDPVDTSLTLLDLNKIKLEAESDKKKAKEKVNKMEEEYNEWKNSIHPDQLQLDLFKDGEFHDNLIHKF